MNTQVGQIYFHQEENEINHKDKKVNYIKNLIFKLWNCSPEERKEGGKEKRNQIQETIVFKNIFELKWNSMRKVDRAQRYQLSYSHTARPIL